MHWSRLGVTARTRITSSQPYYFRTVMTSHVRHNPGPTVVLQFATILWGPRVADSDLRTTRGRARPRALIHNFQPPEQGSSTGRFNTRTPFLRLLPLQGTGVLGGVLQVFVRTFSSHPASHGRRWSFCQFQVQANLMYCTSLHGWPWRFPKRVLPPHSVPAVPI